MRWSNKWVYKLFPLYMCSGLYAHKCIIYFVFFFYAGHYDTLGISSIASISYICVFTSMVFLIILVGRSGIGKTEVGLQLVEEFKQQQQQPEQHRRWQF